MRAALTALALPLVALAAQAQPMMKPSGEPCTLPEVLMAWNKPPATIASVSERRGADPAGSVSQPYRVHLAPCEAAWCKPGGHAAMVKVEVPQAGRWRVALDSMLWIDVWTADTKQEGVLCEHHGCLPLRKIVQYDLKAGPHWVVLVGKAAAETGLLLTRVHD